MAKAPRFDRDKLAAAVMHIVQTTQPDRLGAVKLQKVLYYADMLTHLERGEPITGAVYRKRPFGPATDSLLSVLRDLEREGRLSIDTIDYHGFEKKQFISLVPTSTNVLDSDEKATIDEMVDFVCYNNTARTISEFSHDLVWQMVEFGDVIPYHNAINLIPTLPDQDDMDWAELEVHRVENTGAGPFEVESLDSAAFRGRVAELRRIRQI